MSALPSLPGSGGDIANPPPIVPTIPLPFTPAPASWIPTTEDAMGFTNYLWSVGMKAQAAVFWNMYLQAVSLETKA